MQAIYSDANVVAFPQSILNRPSSRAFEAPVADEVCDAVYVVDGDREVRQEIAAYMGDFGMKVMAFATAGEYLNFAARDTAGCVVLSLRLPDMCGLELQRRLGEREAAVPVIFMSGPCDIASTVRAMKAGAVEFLTKPIDLQALAAAAGTALAQDRRARLRKVEAARLQERYALLTPREREVLPLIVGGLLNKQAASVLGISEVTLQIHRSQVMRKMQADSFAGLVRMAVKLRIPYWRKSEAGIGSRREASVFGLRSDFGSMAVGEAR